jgi:hypothetical protein
MIFPTRTNFLYKHNCCVSGYHICYKYTIIFIISSLPSKKLLATFAVEIVAIQWIIRITEKTKQTCKSTTIYTIPTANLVLSNRLHLQPSQTNPPTPKYTAPSTPPPSPPPSPTPHHPKSHTQQPTPYQPPIHAQKTLQTNFHTQPNFPIPNIYK